MCEALKPEIQYFSFQIDEEIRNSFRLVHSPYVNVCVCLYVDRYGIHYRNCISFRFVSALWIRFGCSFVFECVCVCVSVRATISIIKLYCNLSAGRWTTNLRNLFIFFFFCFYLYSHSMPRYMVQIQSFRFMILHFMPRSRSITFYRACAIVCGLLSLDYKLQPWNRIIRMDRFFVDELFVNKKKTWKWKRPKKMRSA